MIEVEEQIRSLASDLLPFSLIPDRCRALSQSLRDRIGTAREARGGKILGRAPLGSIGGPGWPKLAAPDDEELAQSESSSRSEGLELSPSGVRPPRRIIPLTLSL